MDSAGYLGHLRRDLGAFGECLAGDLAVPVEPCGDWTLYDLADHLGRGKPADVDRMVGANRRATARR